MGCDLVIDAKSMLENCCFAAHIWESTDEGVGHGQRSIQFVFISVEGLQFCNLPFQT